MNKKYFACEHCGTIHTIEIYIHANRKCYFCRKKTSVGEMFKNPYKAVRSFHAIGALYINNSEYGELSIALT
jgi:hypothetical protein